ncbi:hypothetical protein P872_25400 [Rhodonellum psychrophilum GCM71 = DSM 17998]|uniref:Uncharacterized protein n=2 Tax=Rhodonellum TaxID=336827 RepID=U5BV23_9BACT|nr:MULTISPECIES: hypothetical protein [Rhodonellum]ERM84495.1 hypothetical protein P872_25400 [Rhodonellum psychrophilum GCM71 = DSM 17998]SDZ01426.1 hypothetical protein SAMN05444412_104310 [Rhodonellum ikkaensis]
MKLSKPQIDQLKALISKKGYPEIDVQYEILDHVACKVESMLDHHPKLSMEDAFQKVHSEFGIFGFSDLELSYKKTIDKRLRNYFLKELKKKILSAGILIPMALTFVFIQSAYVQETSISFGYGALVLVGFVFMISVIFWWYFAFGKDFKKYKNYASWKGNQGILMFAYVPLQFMFQGYRYIGTFNLLHPFALGFWQIFIILLVLLSFTILNILPAVLKRALDDTKKLEQLYSLV